MMEDWQSDWEDEDTGRSTFNILPRVSTQPCYWKREKILFFAGHGPFPSYLKRFNFARQQIAHVETQTAFLCIIRQSAFCLHLTQQNELIGFRNVASNKGSRLKIQQLLHHLNDFQELFRINP
ncbi:hypothetical protein AVEN_70567-1 [Araneus ventricosus]|uniref:Uncharacterized protein n=1 Tax=Araneus ventricosus TaxID=182803 RepID=A0A4Y2V3B5_ARAVE|nr:hypothetical protein AVEN_45682-1 [Araneus ventricosus]GBO19736.1 hypothetical protein AVEN_72461-1 [Araneus ventricosus]GBO19739.1 hypothetical protein AVEN_59213-1 [Araneus ventricosus]GBO19740.1 hypothetical protein AVEN_70567-1 [Araneus ventricosus]